MCVQAALARVAIPSADGGCSDVSSPIGAPFVRASVNSAIATSRGRSRTDQVLALYTFGAIGGRRRPEVRRAQHDRLVATSCGYHADAWPIAALSQQQSRVVEVYADNLAPRFEIEFAKSGVVAGPGEKVRLIRRLNGATGPRRSDGSDPRAKLTGKRWHRFTFRS